MYICDIYEYVHIRVNDNLNIAMYMCVHIYQYVHIRVQEVSRMDNHTTPSQFDSLPGLSIHPAVSPSVKAQVFGIRNSLL